MEKSQKKSHKQGGLCGKIFRAMSKRSPIQTVRHTSSRPFSPAMQINESASAAPATKPVSANFFTPKPAAEPVHVKFDYSAPSSKKSGEDSFTEYIKRAKLKIRAMTNLGDITNADKPETGRAPAAKESGSKDAFSEYIKRTKNKIRTVSGLGAGSRRHESFKYLKD